MPKIVLLPGLDGTGRLFADFIAELPDSFETIIISYPTNECLCTSELIDIIRSGCPIHDPFVLIAESFSVPLAIHFAASSPVNLKGLVLCAGFVVSPVQGWKRFLGSLLAPIIFCVGLPKLAARQWLIGPGCSSSLLLAVRTALASVKPKVLVSRFHSVLACEARSELVQIEVPILYIQAQQDKLVKSISLNCIRHIKPQVEVVVVDGPHLILQKEPKKAVGAIVRFARSAILDFR